MLTREGIKVLGALFDVQIAHYLLHPDMRHDLSILTENHLQYSIRTLEELTGKGKLRKEIASLEEEDLIFN